MCAPDDLFFAAGSKRLTEIVQGVREIFDLKVGQPWTSTSWVRYLGREYQLHDHGVVVRLPEKLYQGLLRHLDILGAQAVATPGGVSSAAAPGDQAPLDFQQHAEFRTVVGKMLWAMTERPDTMLASKEFARCVQAPVGADLLRLKRLYPTHGVETFDRSECTS